jgi:hypothetical protein
MPLQSHLGALERHAAAARTVLPALWAVLVAANLTLLRATWAPAQPARPPSVLRRELGLTLLCALGLGLPCLLLASRIVEPAPYLMLAGGPVVYELALAALGLSLLLEQGLAAWLGWRLTVPARHSSWPPVPPAPPAALAAPAAPAPAAAVAAGFRPSGRNLLTMALITLCGFGVTGSPTLGGGTLLLAAAGCWALAWRGQLRPAGPRAGRLGAPASAPTPAPPPLDADPALDRTSGNPDGATRWSVPHA